MAADVEFFGGSCLGWYLAVVAVVVWVYVVVREGTQALRRLGTQEKQARSGTDCFGVPRNDKEK